MKSSKFLVIIDGDSLAYQAAYAGDAQLGRSFIDEVLTKVLDEGKKHAKDQELTYKLFIEADGNKKSYRQEVAKTREYKGNRKNKTFKDEEAKEAFKKMMRLKDKAKEYMIKDWNAISLNYMESDDALSIEANKLQYENCMLAHIDKDLDQIPGLHYNYKKHITYNVAERQAEALLAKQVLTGDSVDNIPGLVGIGPKKAIALLKEDPRVITAAKVYKEQGKSYKYFLEQFMLVSLLRFPGQEKPSCYVTEKVWNSWRTDGQRE